MIRYYQGQFILEAYNKAGERIFQRILRDQCVKWRLWNNVLVFKTNPEAPLIHIVWLADKKIASYKHPFEQSREVDFIYHHGCLIVAQEHSFKFVAISPADVTTKLTTYVDPDEVNAPLAEKEASGLISQEKILGFVADSLNKQVNFATLSAASGSIAFSTVRVDQTGRVSLDPKPAQKKTDKKWQKLTTEDHI